MNLVNYARKNGVIRTVEEVFSRFRLWDLGEDKSFSLGTGSSFSDNPDYLSIVVMASNDEQVFKKFRSNREYRKILEHVTRQLGEDYIKEFSDKGDLKKTLSLLKNCDRTGGPVQYYFRGVGFYSPTTIRYAFVHSQLEQKFGSLGGLRVLEIGGGFGGQAAVSSTLTRNLDWVIFDLPDVLALQSRYLSRVNPNTTVAFRSGLHISPTEGDLLISNYALSEISRELQMEYLHKVVLNCKRGYMAWNTISEKEIGGLSLLEVLDLIPGASAVAEKPLSDPGNVIIVWGS